MRARSWAAVLGLSAVLGLGACGDGGHIALLERDRLATDRLPQGLQGMDGIDPESARLAVTDRGIRYYVAQADRTASGCILAVDRRQELVAGGCGGLGGRGLVVEVQARPAVALVTDDADTRQLQDTGWRSVHPNILVYDVAG